MRYNIIGMGRLGIAIGNALMLIAKDNVICFYEPLVTNRLKAKNGEFLEMCMVAKATGNKVLFAKTMPASGVFIITAGVARKTSKDSKVGLFNTNVQIMGNLIKNINPRYDIFIATNPPNELSKFFNTKGYMSFPLRNCTDSLRRAVWGNEWNTYNEIMLNTKGYTSYGAAIAIVNEILRVD
jgi:malate/lactate dehydrogenase